MACFPRCLRGLTITTQTDVSPLNLLGRQLKKRKCKKEIIMAYFASVWWHNEKSLNVKFLKEGMSLVAKAWFHLVVSIQTLQGRPCDVNLAESTSRAEDDKQLIISQASRSQIIILNFLSLIFFSVTTPHLA